MERYLKEMISSLQKLISFRSIKDKKSPGAPYGKEIGEALAEALSISKALGFRTKDADGFYGYAETGPENAEIFAVLCHLDVVPFSKADWKHDPLGGEIDGGRLYGRGALDDKGPTVAALYAVKAMLDQGFAFKKRVRFIFGLDEESGEWKSVARYIKDEGMPASGIAPDADFPVINSEKGKVNFSLKIPCPPGCPIIEFKAGERANIVPDSASLLIDPSALIGLSCEQVVEKAEALKLTAELTPKKFVSITALGRAAHGAHPEKGENAALKLLNFLKTLKIAPFSSLYEKLSDYNGKGLNIAYEDRVSGKLTMNAGIFKKRKNDGFLTVEIDVRYPHNVTKELIFETLKKSRLFKAAMTGFHRPLYVPETDPLVEALVAAYNKITGRKERPISIGGATFARALDYGVAFGPIFPDSVSSIHEADENISLDDLLKTAEIYREAFKNLL